VVISAQTPWIQAGIPGIVLAPIIRASIVYDSRNLSATGRNELAALTLEPLQ
jgi:hypothetical protein